MQLQKLIQTGPSIEPLRIVLQGVEGVGKTTFAATAPGAVFIGPEDGGGDLDLHRITVASWSAALDAVRALTDEPHDYRVVVFDTIDFLERLLHLHLTKGEKSMEKIEGGYGKGYKVAAEEMLRLITALDALRSKRRMAVIGLAHTEIKKFDDPSGAAYDRYQIRMHKDTAAMWSGWADCVLFANFDVRVRVNEGGGTAEILKKGKAVDRAPERVLYTERRPAFDAKNRYGLAFEIPLSWDAFAAAIRWNERDAKCRGRSSTPPQRDTTATPTAEDVARAMGEAKARGWTNSQLMEVVDSFGAAKGSEIAPNRRAGAIRAFSGSPLSAHQEAK
jgi:hypothetical protein